MMIANTPQPPYYAVIFSSIKTEVNDGYSEMADLMVELARKQEGFIGVESARNELGITVSYWKDLESIRKWKQNSDHLIAQNKGRADWYKHYKTRIAKVERDYGFDK
ncbi:antibiotic biosynthesis monooxygenase family protein [Desertivirga brevis]|uniref:antibiotic biosynthesis monooxygenase family protein n=1 Tax=Desertivirga brevis TaxID=2810310 RepID=UPI001F601E4F|nr:antibiotic biosynthesis monooxygenase [Pedobacter sp. SYSU D00873]